MGNNAALDAQPQQAKTIMVIDDDQVYLEWLNEVLSEEGYTVITHADGTSAVEHVRRNQPNLVILDLMMPEVSGWSILNSLREDAALRDIPVLIASATRDDLRRYGPLVNMLNIECIEKPFDLEITLSKIAEHCGNA